MSLAWVMVQLAILVVSAGVGAALSYPEPNWLVVSILILASAVLAAVGTVV